MRGIIKGSLVSLVIAVSSLGFNAQAHSQGQAADAINSAKAALKKADSVDGAWRDTGKMIKKAESLLKEGKYTEAAKEAMEARDQGMLGYDQAVSQSSRKLHI
tara:strand:+ start:51 stop:359 length:309 start_codon:yes stop_codon:yes gene_type:complete